MNLLKYRFSQKPPIKLAVEDFTDTTLRHLFPEMVGKNQSSKIYGKVKKKLRQVLKINDVPRLHRKVIIRNFIFELPKLKASLTSDANFIAQSDPAATNMKEVIISYPGFFAICVYRISHLLANMGVELIPRIMTEYAHSLTGIDIHPKAKIGNDLFIDHGTGIVVGETAIIGNRVKICQGVTIGAINSNNKNKRTKRHPTIQSDVTIYAGSTILGGNTTIGHHSVIGGNVWLTESIAPYSFVVNNGSTITKRGKE